MGYKKSIGGSDSYHYGKFEGVDRRYIRIIAGASLPILNRVQGAVVVIAEQYRSSGPPSWIAIGAAVGKWSHVENSMVQFRMDLKFTHVVVDREEARQVIWTIRGLSWGISDIPLVTYTAPSYASEEVGRSYVGQLWRTEGRLTLPDGVKKEINEESQQGALALQCALCWMKEFPAIYVPTRQDNRRQGMILGMEGLD